MPWMIAVAAGLIGFVPLLGWLASVIIAIVTLQQGMKAGFIVACFAAIPNLVYGLQGFTTDYWSIGFSCLYVWMMASLLLKTASWSKVLNITALFALLLIGALHSLTVDIQLWWYRYMIGNIQHVSILLGNVSAGDIQSFWNQLMYTLVQKGVVNQLAFCMTGIVVTCAMILNLFNLILARWWCLRRSKEGKVTHELSLIQPHYLLAIGLIGFTAISYFAASVRDAAVALAILLFCSGISLMHWFLARVKFTWLWVITVYVLLVFFPISVSVILIVLSILDAFISFRKRGV